MGLLDLALNIIIYIFLGIIALIAAVAILFPKEFGYMLDGMNVAFISDSIKSIAGVVARFFGATAGTVVSGVLLGLCGVWVLVKTGKIDELVKLGDSVMQNGWGRKLMLAIRCFPPVIIFGMIGIIAIDLVKFQFLSIPGDVLKVLLSSFSAAKELFTGRP